MEYSDDFWVSFNEKYASSNEILLENDLYDAINEKIASNAMKYRSKLYSVERQSIKSSRNLYHML